MSRTQTGAPLASPPHRTSLLLSYMLPPFPRSSTSIPISPTPSGGSIPPPENCRWWKTTFVPSTRMKRPPSAVSHTPRRPAPSAPQSPQPPTSVAYSLSYPGTSLRLGAPNLGPHVEQTCHTGGTGGGVDFPPPGLLFCSEGIGDQIVPGGLSVSTLSLGIPPQVTSIGQG